MGTCTNKATKTMKRNWKQATACSVVFFIMCTFLPILGGCSSKSSQQDTKVQQTEQVPSTAALHEGKISDLKALLAKADSIPPAELRSGLVTAKEDLASLNSKMEGEFANTSEVLARLNLPEKMKIQEDVVAKFNSSKDRLNAALDETVASSDSDINARSASLYGLVNELCPEEESQPLGTELPNQLVERDPVAPVLGTNIAPAYMHGAPGLTPSDLPVDPTPADLAPTIDAQHSQEIIDKAAELENDPVKIYEWVRNNIDFEPYYGSKKGATETMAEMAGNDMDTASLLISLYRVSGIPARYVTGVIEITADQAMAWTAVKTPEAALRLFASGGTPVTGIQEGGQITRVQLTHTYTEAYLNYSNYRGAAGGEGPKEWIPLDGSYKEYIREVPFDASSISYDFEGLIDQAVNNSTITQDGYGISNIPQEQFNVAVEDYVSLISQKLTDLGEEKSALVLTGRRYINSIELGGYLPTTTSFKVIENQQEKYELGDEESYRLRLELAGSVYQSRLTAIASSSITIIYHAATENDSAIINEYGQMQDVPAYMVEQKPMMIIDGNVVFDGDPTLLGLSQELDISIEGPGLILNTSHDICSGGYYSLTLDSGEISRSRIKKHSERLDHAIAMLTEGEQNPQSNAIFYPDELLGEINNLTGLSYFIQLDTISEIMASMRKIRFLRFPSEALIGTKKKTNMAFGVPLSSYKTGTFIDVGSIRDLIISENGERYEELNCTSVLGVISSMLESGVLSQCHGSTAVSSMDLLALANAQGIPVYQVTSENAGSLLPAIPLDDNEKNTITSFVRGGGFVLVPGQAIMSNGWQGMFWIMVDRLSGSSGFYISGGLAGAEDICTQAEDILTGLERVIAALGPAESLTIDVAGGVLDVKAIIDTLKGFKEILKTIGDEDLDPEIEQTFTSAARALCALSLAMMLVDKVLGKVPVVNILWAPISKAVGVALEWANWYIPYMLNVCVMLKDLGVTYH